jgi:hypothetical protein
MRDAPCAADESETLMNATVSAAEFDLTRRQRKWPPWTDLPWAPPDATQRATPRRLMNMWPIPAQARLASALAGRDFRIGELGISAPNAVTQNFSDGSVCIRLHGGLIDFVHAVTRILFAGTNMTERDQPALPAVAGPDIVAHRLSLLYEQWRGGQVWSGQRLRVEGFQLPDSPANRAEHLAHTALLFFLCHEIGHAVLHADIAPDERSAAQEHQADAYGLDLAIRGYGIGKPDVKMAIAGALVAIRILAALQLLGHAFPGIHPSPLARLDRLRRAVRRMCDSRRSYIEFTTIAYAFEEQMQAAELRIQSRTTVTDERLVSRLYAMLFEYARDALPFDRMRADFLNDMKDASPSTRARAGRSARMVLSLASPGFQDDHYRRMVAGFEQLVAALPPGQHQDFTAREPPAMPILECENDTLTRILNARRFEPLLMPRTNLTAPDIWVYDNNSLVWWGSLADFVPPGLLPTVLDSGEMPDLNHVETSRKGASAAGSFLRQALACIGVSSAPKLDLSFGRGRDIAFSFADITTRGVAPASLGRALAQFAPGIIPHAQVAAGMVHVAYEYAYAETLNMRFAADASASLNLKALQLDGFIDLGGKADIKVSSETTLSFKGKGAPAAFAFKVGQLVRERGKWAFHVTEILGQGATADEGAIAEPYLLRPGAVLVGEERPAA